jgi:serine/threonine-protein kinase
MIDHIIHYSEQDDRGEPTVLGRYEVLERVGASEGTQGRVYRGRDLESGRLVAIKLLTHEYESFAASVIASLIRQQDSEELRREGEVLAKLHHPNIVEVIETGEDAAYGPYVLTEWVEGGNLRDRLDQAPDKRLSLDESLRIARDVLAGLAAAHEAGIVHRDIKPENILLTKDGHVKLADFGVASEASMGLAGRGTAGYMAPEQEDPSLGAVGPASDVYAVGVVLFEMLAGRLPAAQEDRDVALAGVPLSVSNTMERSLRPDPRERFQSAEEMRRAL